MAGRDGTARLAGILARLGVGEVLRLRHGAGHGDLLGEVHARPDGTLEVPAVLTGDGDALALFPRTRTGPLAGRILAAHPDLDLALATLVDGAGVERTLDGAVREAGADDPDRFDAALPAQVQRFLAARSGGPLRAFTPDPAGNILLVLRGGTVLLQPVDDGRLLIVRTPLVTGVDPQPELDATLATLGSGRLLRFLHERGTVWTETVLPVFPFVGAHLDRVLTELDRNVLDLVAGLHRRFGGERLYPDGTAGGDPEGGGTARDDRGDRGEEQG